MNPQASPIRVFLADDHPVFRLGLSQIVNAASGLSVVGEAGDGEQAWQRLRGSPAVDVAVLDVDMPQRDGFEVLKALRESGSTLPVVFLTMHRDEHFLNRALDLEVNGYLLKDSALTEVVDCIRMVAAGQPYVSPLLSSFLMQRHRRTQASQQRATQLRSLTGVELRVLKLVSEFCSNRQIAEQLGISVRTVEHHRARMCVKLDLDGHNALLRFAQAHAHELASNR
ncbi:MAG: response regulator transcription factor [Xanthomonadales bacterium]|jgi:DNA-binding NarL/FixJ family response regulator|nr:response regulator transcription factor [Xanthomonadales bacterium]